MMTRYVLVLCVKFSDAIMAFVMAVENAEARFEPVLCFELLLHADMLEILLPLYLMFM
jgi:hypothetical protein